MKHKKMLNLWPTPERERAVDAQQQLLLEGLFAGLLAVLCVGGTWMYLNWRTTQANSVNQTLQQSLTQLQAQVGAQSNGDVQLLQWRNQNAGQLDWLVALAEVSSPEVVFFSVKQSEAGDKLMVTGQTTDPAFAKNALNNLVEKSKPHQLLKLTMFEKKSEEEQSAWLFGAELDASAKVKESADAQATAEPADNGAQP